jgi:hypothetical protein
MFSIFPGEFIDISIPRYTETDKYFNELYIQKYEIKGNNPFEFLSYSTNGFITDLIETLELNNNNGKLPWDTPKFDVRLNRLFTLFFIDLLSNLSNKDCIQIITIIYDIFNKLRNLRITDYNIITEIEKILNEFQNSFLINNSYTTIKLVLFIEHYFTNKYCTSILAKIKAANINIDNINKYFTMIENIMTILDTLKTTFKKNEDYKSKDIISINKQSDLELSDLNSKNINIKYDKKYLKYKNKYLDLKKKLNN